MISNFSIYSIFLGFNLISSDCFFERDSWTLFVRLVSMYNVQKYYTSLLSLKREFWFFVRSCYLLPSRYISIYFVWTGRFLEIIYHWNGWYFTCIAGAVASRAIWTKSTLLNQLNVSKWPGRQRANASPFKLFPGFKQRESNASGERNRLIISPVFHYIARSLDQRSAVSSLANDAKTFCLIYVPIFVSKSNL